MWLSSNCRLLRYSLVFQSLKRGTKIPKSTDLSDPARVACNWTKGPKSARQGLLISVIGDRERTPSQHPYRLKEVVVYQHGNCSRFAEEDRRRAPSIIQLTHRRAQDSGLSSGQSSGCSGLKTEMDFVKSDFVWDVQCKTHGRQTRAITVREWVYNENIFRIPGCEKGPFRVSR